MKYATNSRFNVALYNGGLHKAFEGTRVHAQRYAVLALAQIAVGAAAIFARFALTGAPPLAVAASRLGIAAAVLLLIAALRHGEESGCHPEPVEGHPEASKGVTPIFLAAGIALAIHFASWIWSLEYTSVAISTLLVATTPIWTALYDSAVHKRHLSPLAWLAVVIGGAGLVLVVGFTTTRPPIPGHDVLGAALAITGAIAIGAYFILVREVRSSFSTRAIVTRTYTWAAVALIVASAAARQSPPAIADAKAWGGIIAMALISQLMGHTAMNAALRWFSPSAVAFTTLLEPVVAALLALAIFGERLTSTALAGGVLVLLAIGMFLREEAATA